MAEISELDGLTAIQRRKAGQYAFLAKLAGHVPEGALNSRGILEVTIGSEITEIDPGGRTYTRPKPIQNH